MVGETLFSECYLVLSLKEKYVLFIYFWRGESEREREKG